MAAARTGLHVPTRFVKIENGDIVINFAKANVGITQIIGLPRWEAIIHLQGRKIKNKREVSSQYAALGEKFHKEFVDLYFELMNNNTVKLIVDIRVFGVKSSDDEPIWVIAIVSQDSEAEVEELE